MGFDGRGVTPSQLASRQEIPRSRRKAGVIEAERASIDTKVLERLAVMAVMRSRSLAEMEPEKPGGAQ